MDLNKLKEIKNINTLNEKLYSLQETGFKISKIEDFNIFKEEIIKNKNFLFLVYILDHLEHKKINESVHENEIKELIYGDHLIDLLHDKISEIESLINLYENIIKIIDSENIEYDGLSHLIQKNKELSEEYSKLIKNIKSTENIHNSIKAIYEKYIYIPEKQKELYHLVKKLKIDNSVKYNFNNKFKII